MEEARCIDVRLRRIDALRAAGAGPRVLLVELRALLREGEAWVAAEGPGTERAARALRALEASLRAADRGARTPFHDGR